MTHHKIRWEVVLARVIGLLLGAAALFTGTGAGVPLLHTLPMRDQQTVLAVCGFLLAFLPKVQNAAGILRAAPPAPPDGPLTAPAGQPPARTPATGPAPLSDPLDHGKQVSP